MSSIQIATVMVTQFLMFTLGYAAGINAHRRRR